MEGIDRVYLYRACEVYYMGRRAVKEKEECEDCKEESKGSDPCCVFVCLLGLQLSL